MTKEWRKETPLIGTVELTRGGGGSEKVGAGIGVEDHEWALENFCLGRGNERRRGNPVVLICICFKRIFPFFFFSL